MNPETQCARCVLMVRPVSFHANPLTMDSNAFMKGDLGLSDEQQQDAALEEFEGLVRALRRAEIEVLIFDDSRTPATPDSIFPNNWVSFHADGTVVLYPMMAENRRTERRTDILQSLSDSHGFTVSSVIDLSPHETQRHFLEGTGSLVLDRRSRVAYACLSPRTSLDALGDFAQQLEYDVIAFDALDAHGTPVYHTNVMMAHGDGFVVICDESVRDASQRTALLGKLRKCGQEVISISYRQMECFAGNMLELENLRGDKVLAMSQRACASLGKDQLARLAQYAELVVAPINMIEDSAGGSVRCMLAEIFLPRQTPAVGAASLR